MPLSIDKIFIFQVNNKTKEKDITLHPELNDEKFITEFTKSTVQNWKGFKLEYLHDLLLVDLKDQNPETELEFSEENALQLVENSSDPSSEDYLSISTSWELGFSNYNLILLDNNEKNIASETNALSKTT